MAKETQPLLLSPIIDPEELHAPDHIMFMNPNESISTIMYPGKPYQIDHIIPMPATYRGNDVIVHRVQGIFAVEMLEEASHREPRFRCVLRQAEVVFSYTANPEERQTATTDAYYFHLTTASTVTEKPHEETR